MTTSSGVDGFLEAIESVAIPSCDAWSKDATLDAIVPNWRLHAVGAEAIRAECARWFADPGRSDDLRRGLLGDGSGEVVEYTLSWQENGLAHAAHHMHLLTVRDGQILADTVMCGATSEHGSTVLQRFERDLGTRGVHRRVPGVPPTAWCRARPERCANAPARTFGVHRLQRRIRRAQHD